MLNQYKTKRQEGFTIIEVLIVLAIAGLIILIVFLAVPALQRNSRNTQRKNDASALLSGASEFSNNNDGRLPKVLPPVDDTNAVKANAKTSSITNLTIQPAGSTTLLTPPLDSAYLVTGVKCNLSGGDTMTPTTTGASTRSMILVYAVENSQGSPIAQCIES